MKKILSLFAAVVAAVTVCVNAQVSSTLVELSPATYSSSDASDDTKWYFNDTEVYMTNSGNKTWRTISNYTNGGVDTVTTDLMKLSRQKTYTIEIPSDSAVVRIELYGLSNSSEAQNWDYLGKLDNGSDLVIYEEAYEDVLDNDSIQSFGYPISPLASDYGTAFATFSEDLGWYTELNLYIDGNNTAGILIKLYLVADAEISSYDSSTDPSIVTGLEEVVKTETDDGTAYDLFGRPVSEDSYKGIFIKNGKKYIVK